jgi:hypothetical protein
MVEHAGQIFQIYGADHAGTDDANLDFTHEYINLFSFGGDLVPSLSRIARSNSMDCSANKLDLFDIIHPCPQQAGLCSGVKNLPAPGTYPKSKEAS